MTVVHVKHLCVVIQTSLQESAGVCVAECVCCPCRHTGDCGYEQERLTIQILYCAVMFHFVIRKRLQPAGFPPGAKASKPI